MEKAPLLYLKEGTGTTFLSAPWVEGMQAEFARGIKAEPIEPKHEMFKVARAAGGGDKRARVPLPSPARAGRSRSSSDRIAGSN